MVLLISTCSRRTGLREDLQAKVASDCIRHSFRISNFSLTTINLIFQIEQRKHFFDVVQLKIKIWELASGTLKSSGSSSQTFECGVRLRQVASAELKVIERGRSSKSVIGRIVIQVVVLSAD